MAATDRVPVAIDAGSRTMRTMSVARLRLHASTLVTSCGLPAGSEDALFAVLREEQARRTAILEDLHRNADQAGVQERVRTEVEAIQAWKAKELGDRFGTQLAAVLLRR